MDDFNDDELDDLESQLLLENTISSETNTYTNPKLNIPTENFLNDDELDELESQLLKQNEAEKSNNSKTTKPHTSITKTTPKLTLTDSLFTSNFEEKLAESEAKIKSLIHSGDTDSSDDEDAKNAHEQRYNDFGRNVNSMLREKYESAKDKQIGREIDQSTSVIKSSPFPSSSSRLSRLLPDKQLPSPSTIKIAPPIKTNEFMDISENVSSIYIDPVFGMRITRPVISSTLLKERVQGKTPVSMLRIARFLETNDLKQDWIIAGVILNKSATKKSQKGSQYSIWKLSDLKGDIKTISLFLFSSAYKDLWKTPEGTIIAVLNPTVFDKRTEKSDEACLSIDNSQKVMILGISKDLGKCRSKKKNGEPCTTIVNVTDCAYCVYHVKQEYGNASKRGEFQSATVGRGIHDLRNKVLGKTEVFYAGQSFSAIKAVKNPKQIKKDQDRLMRLSDMYQSPFQNQNSKSTSQSPATYIAKGPSEMIAASVDSSVKQRQKDINLLQKLRAGSSTTDSIISDATNKLGFNNSSTVIAATKINKNISSSTPTPPVLPDKYQNFSFMKKTPILSKSNFSFEITPRGIEYSRSKALEILKKKPLEKSNPNFIKHRGTENGKKRALEEMNKQTETPATKKLKLDEDKAVQEKRERIERIINAQSSHVDLIEARENDNQEKYFNNLEKKEAMEEKMLNTMSIACKAVICRECKYMAFSASDLCKTQKHPLRVVDGEKRFFKCGDCGNRTATLFRIPKVSCKNCSSSKWVRAAMIREKNITGEALSIRGDEESYIGSMMIKGGSINLLVPE